MTTGHIFVIAEKPDMARTFAKVLGKRGPFKQGDGYFINDKYIICWGYGHILATKEPRDYPKEIFSGWSWDNIPFVPPSGHLEYHIPVKNDFDKVKKEHFKKIQKVVKENTISLAVNACDSEREGTLIGNEIIEALGIKAPVRRFWCSTKVDEDILNAFDNLKGDDFHIPRSNAAYCRQYADYVLGNNLTIAFTLKADAKNIRTQKGGGNVIHAGRVSTSIMAILAKRRLEIENFVPVNYFEIAAVFGDKYKGTWYKGNKSDTKIDSKEEADALVSKIKGKEGKVIAKDVTIDKEGHKELYNLSTLQNDANKKYGYTMQKTLDIAQVLYETYKVLSYPRTDSKYLTKSQIPELPILLDSIRGSEYDKFIDEVVAKGIPTSSKFVNDAKVSDHYALIPTKKKVDWTAFKDEYDNKKKIVATKEELLNIFNLVVKRFLAVFFPPTIYEKTEIITEVEGETFKTNGKILVDLGWKAIYGNSEEKDENDSEDEKSNDKTLPPIDLNEVNMTTKEESLAKATKPKAHYTDATLNNVLDNARELIDDEELKGEMKIAKAGLGTSATRANLVENIIKRGYAIRKNKSIIASDLAVKVISITPERLASPEITAQWEQSLRLIEEGKLTVDDFTSQILTFVKAEIENLKAADSNVSFAVEKESVGTCPKCNGDIHEYPSLFACTSSSREHSCFKMFRKVSDKTLSKTHLKQLLTKGETSLIKGFKTKSGISFNAKLVFKGIYEGLDFKREVYDGTCAKCSKGIVDRVFFITCDSHSKENPCFAINKERSGVTLSKAAIEQLASGQKTDLIDNFVTKDGKRTFSAHLNYNNGNLEFVFPERKVVEKKETENICPGCHKGKVIEYEKKYGCSEFKNGCKFTVWRKISGKEINLDLMYEIIENGCPEKLDGFISRANKPFLAKLEWNSEEKTIKMKFD